MFNVKICLELFNAETSDHSTCVFNNHANIHRNWECSHNTGMCNVKLQSGKNVCLLKLGLHYSNNHGGLTLYFLLYTVFVVIHCIWCYTLYMLLYIVFVVIHFICCYTLIILVIFIDRITDSDKLKYKTDWEIVKHGREYKS